MENSGYLTKNDRRIYYRDKNCLKIPTKSIFSNIAINSEIYFFYNAHPEIRNILCKPLYKVKTERGSAVVYNLIKNEDTGEIAITLKQSIRKHKNNDIIQNKLKKIGNLLRKHKIIIPRFHLDNL